MGTVDESFLLMVLKAIAADEPMYPAQFAKEKDVDRVKLDDALDELRRLGLVRFTEWVKSLGQGYALTPAGDKAVETNRVPSAPAPAATAPESRPLSYYQRGEIVRNAIVDPPMPLVGRILLALTLIYFAYGAVFAWQHNQSVGEYLRGDWPATGFVLIEIGGLSPTLVFPHPADPLGRLEAERLMLYAFLHIGVLHLAFNMLSLVWAGRQIEAMWGRARYLAIYLIAGFVGGCVVLLIEGMENPPRPVLTAGASGCLFGVYAAMIVWFSLNYQHLPDHWVQDWSRSMMYNVIWLVAINFMPGVSWSGHFGGAVGGFLVAILLHFQRFHPLPTVRWLALAGVPLVPVAFFIAVLWQAGWI